MIILSYHQRLGDIIRCLPIARHLAAQGNEVAIECLPQYHSLFHAVSYVRPLLPGHRVNGERIALEIWPDRYADYRASRKTWEDYVYGLDPRFAGMDRQIVFDRLDPEPIWGLYGMTKSTALVSPFGYSQVIKVAPALICQHAFEQYKAPLRVVADPYQAEACIASGWSESLFVVAQSTSDLIRILRDAREVMTVNSAPAVICSAVRQSFDLVRSGMAQDDVHSPAARVVTFGA
jgi:hypothetical protein